MIKKFLIIIVFASLIKGVFAQDIIVKKDGDIIRAKVVELDETTIKYKTYTNLDGPIHSIKIENIISLTYENGEKEAFSNITNNAPVQDYIDQNNKTVSMSVLQSQIANLDSKAKTIRVIGNTTTIITSLAALAGFVIVTKEASVGNILLGTGILLGIDFGGLMLTNALARPTEEEAEKLREKMQSMTPELSFQPSVFMNNETNVNGVGLSVCLRF